MTQLNLVHFNTKSIKFNIILRKLNKNAIKCYKILLEHDMGGTSNDAMLLCAELQKLDSI